MPRSVPQGSTFNPDIPLVPNREDLYTSGLEFLPQEKIAAFNNLMSFLQEPLAGVGEAIRPLLDELVPSEQLARRNLADAFRKTGSLRDSSFGRTAARLEGDLFSRRGQTATKAGLAFLAPLISGRVGALTGIPALRQTIGSIGRAPSYGGGGGSFSGFGFPSSDQEISNAYSRINSNPLFSGYGDRATTPLGIDPFGTDAQINAAIDKYSNSVGMYSGNPGSGPTFGYSPSTLQEALSDPGIMNFQVGSQPFLSFLQDTQPDQYEDLGIGVY